ncbi:unnamed protein product [Durusdinium trenchii]|uniref:C2H2-type domain-containing protein n=1 Tax=Durusdinium trenchii TaxID=1381693 RepID=A0ABP0RXV2_9DINO
MPHFEISADDMMGQISDTFGNLIEGSKPQSLKRPKHELDGGSRDTSDQQPNLIQMLASLALRHESQLQAIAIQDTFILSLQPGQSSLIPLIQQSTQQWKQDVEKKQATMSLQLKLITTITQTLELGKNVEGGPSSAYNGDLARSPGASADHGERELELPDLESKGAVQIPEGQRSGLSTAESPSVDAPDHHRLYEVLQMLSMTSEWIFVWLARDDSVELGLNRFGLTGADLFARTLDTLYEQRQMKMEKYPEQVLERLRSFCSMCGKLVVSHDALKRHAQLRHSELGQVIEVDQFMQENRDCANLPCHGSEPAHENRPIPPQNEAMKLDALFTSFQVAVAQEAKNLQKFLDDMEVFKSSFDALKRSGHSWGTRHPRLCVRKRHTEARAEEAAHGRDMVWTLGVATGVGGSGSDLRRMASWEGLAQDLIGVASGT